MPSASLALTRLFGSARLAFDAFDAEPTSGRWSLEGRLQAECVEPPITSVAKQELSKDE